MGIMSLQVARKLAVAALACVGLTAATASTSAQGWTPTKPVELVIGNAPGGAMDRLVRLAEEFLKGKNLIPAKSIVLHKPGGGHAVALAYMKSKSRDPHYLMAVNTLLTSNNLLGRSELKHSDFMPVSILYEEPMVFAVKGDSKIKDAADLADRLKKDPGSVSFSVSAGLGTSNHMAAVLLAKAVGAPIKALKAVSFNSGSEGITAVLGGHVDVVVTAPGSMLQFVNSKEMRIVALAGDMRVGGALANVPTWKEVGYDVTVSAWRGIIAPPALTAGAGRLLAEGVRGVHAVGPVQEERRGGDLHGALSQRLRQCEIPDADGPAVSRLSEVRRRRWEIGGRAMVERDPELNRGGANVPFLAGKARLHHSRGRRDPGGGLCFGRHAAAYAGLQRSRGSALVPYLIALGLVLSCVALVVEHLSTARRTADAAASSRQRRHPRGAATVGLLVAYYLLFDVLGFIVATALFLLALLSYTNRGRWVVNIAVATLFPVAAYVLLATLLGARLPAGILQIG